MNIRTDLAVELRAAAQSPNDGITEQTYTHGEISVSRIEIINEKGEKQLCRPCGSYVTIMTPPLHQADEDARECVTNELRRLLPKSGSVLVCGIGNADITPDALGPLCANTIFATRHIDCAIAESIGLYNRRPVSVITPGVLGKTGIECGELILGVIRATLPDAVIAVDALAARGTERLCRTVQLSDTGIVPGSGVGNARQELSEKTLGIPVISVGIPTVIDAQTLAADLCCNSSHNDKSGMIVTPREIDLMIKRGASLLSQAINCALFPQLSSEQLRALTA